MADRDDLHEQLDAGGAEDEPLMEGLVFDDEPVDTPPPVATESPMVVRSLRLPLDLYLRLKSAADSHQVPVSTLLRQWIEQQLAELEDDQPISRADAIRALANVRTLGAA